MGEVQQKQTMKYFKLIAVLSLFSAGAFAADVVKQEESPYKAGVVTASPFASYRVHEFGKFDGKWGGGLAVDYSFTKNLTLELSTLSEGYSHGEAAVNSLDEASANFKFYVPIKNSGLAPYGLLGYTHDLNSGDDDWRTRIEPQSECQDPTFISHSRDRGDNRMNAGVGIEYRYKFAKVFADGVWSHDFEALGHALFRIGGGLTF